MMLTLPMPIFWKIDIMGQTQLLIFGYTYGHDFLAGFRQKARTVHPPGSTPGSLNIWAELEISVPKSWGRKLFPPKSGS